MTDNKDSKYRGERVFELPLRPTKPKDDEDYEDLVFWVTGNKKTEEKPIPEKAFESKIFEEYYKKQGIVEDGKEEDFAAFIRRPLPLSIRFHGPSNEASLLMQALQREYFSKLAKAGSSNGVIKAPECVEWYPEQRAWCMEFDQKMVEENKMLKEMNRIIREEVEAGFISVQEVASMLPVLLLDIKPHHKVLDTRAAPGDKSIQILEQLHSSSDLLDATGFLLCNETHIKQCQKLLHRFSKSFSPNFALVNMDASALPEVFMPNEAGGTESIFYDRVLCDLPSSGDGLYRKNLDGLRCWTPSSPLTQHPALIKLLHSGLGGLAIGGELVFSAHTINPIECEAVMHAVLVQQKGTVELVDLTNRMPNIIHSLGLEKWQVMTKGPRWFKTFSEVPEHYLNLVPDTAFPPEGEDEEVKKYNLNRCIRILPHDQDTAGLFVAVLRRTSSLYEAWLKEQEEITRAWEAAEAERLAKKEEERKKAEEEAERKRQEEEQQRRLEEEEQKKNEAEEKDEDKSDEVEKTESKEDKVDESAEKMEEDESAKAEGKEEKEGEKHEKDDKEKGEDEKKKKSNTERNRAQREAKKEKRREEREKNKEEEERKRRLEAQREEYKQTKATAEDPDKEKKKREGSLITPYLFMAEDSPVWAAISSFYGISGGFPHTRLASQLMFGKPRILYLVSESMKQLILLNQNITAFLHVGVRMFFVYESPYPVQCNFVVAQEGIQILLPYLNDNRSVLLSKKDVLTLLSSHSASIDSLSVKTKQQLNKMESGGCIFIYQLETSSKRKVGNQLAISGWKNDVMCRAFLSTNQRHHYHRIAGGNPKELDELTADASVHEAMSSFARQFTLAQSVH